MIGIVTTNTKESYVHIAAKSLPNKIFLHKSEITLNLTFLIFLPKKCIWCFTSAHYFMQLQFCAASQKHTNISRNHVNFCYYDWLQVKSYFYFTLWHHRLLPQTDLISFLISPLCTITSFESSTQIFWVRNHWSQED